MIIAQKAQENTFARARERRAEDTERVGRWMKDIELDNIITSASQRGYGSIKLSLKDCPKERVFFDTMTHLGYHIITPKCNNSNVITVSWTHTCESTYPEENKIYNEEGTDNLY